MSLMMSYFVLSFSHEMSWMSSGTELSQFLRLVLPTLGINIKISSDDVQRKRTIPPSIFLRNYPPLKLSG